MKRTHTSEIGVGSTVYVFDENHRIYQPGISSPIFREYFREQKVVGETSRSWLVGYGGRDVKRIDKKTREGIFDARGVDEACELHDLWPKVHGAWFRAGRILTLEQVRQIATWLGVPP